jgi:hypothetical protein
MKTIIHVNQHEIRKNKDGQNRPVLTCKTYKGNNYAHEAIIRDENELELARIVYRPDNPRSCGAKVWIETQNKVEIVK